MVDHNTADAPRTLRGCTIPHVGSSKENRAQALRIDHCGMTRSDTNKNMNSNETAYRCYCHITLHVCLNKQVEFCTRVS